MGIISEKLPSIDCNTLLGIMKVVAHWIEKVSNKNKDKVYKFQIIRCKILELSYAFHSNVVLLMLLKF